MINKKQEIVKNTIKVNPIDIKNTDTFKKLSFIQQRVHLNRNSRIAIQNSVNLCSFIGIEQWLAKTTSSHYHREIVKEIVEKNSKKSC